MIFFISLSAQATESLVDVPVTAFASMLGRMKELVMSWNLSLGGAGQPVGFQDHIAADPAVTAAGAALGPIGFADERDRAFAAVASLGVHLDLVNEHTTRS